MWWANQLATFTNIVANQLGVFDLLVGLTEADRSRLTANRLLLHIHVEPVSAGAEFQFQHYVAKLDDDAFNAGEVPEPATDDWGYWLHDGASKGAAISGAPESFDRNYDIRTSRKLGREDVLAHVIENTHATASLRYSIFARVLLKL